MVTDLCLLRQRHVEMSLALLEGQRVTRLRHLSGSVDDLQLERAAIRGAIEILVLSVRFELYPAPPIFLAIALVHLAVGVLRNPKSIRLAGDATAPGGGEPPGQSVVAPAAAW